MRTRRNRKRRTSFQNLETRKLFAADIWFGDMAYGPEAPAEIGSVRPGKVERPTFGPIGDTCPPCELENQVEASTTPEPNDRTARTHWQMDFTDAIEPVKEIRAGLIAIETAQRVPFLENSHPMHHLNPHHPEYPTASHW